MSRWFRFYDDAISDPKVLKLSDKSYRAWLGLLCIASKNDGRLPPLDDCALVLRLQPERLSEAIVALVGAGLLERDGDAVAPSDWTNRQYKDPTAAERAKRYRDGRRDVTRDGRDANGTVTALTDQNRENRTEPSHATLVEVLDPEALAAWDAYGRATTGKPYPRNKRGGWHLPTKFPPLHALIGRTA